MARLRGEVVVEALAQHWFEGYVRALLDRAEDLTLDDDGWIQGDEDLADVTLVEGEHLTPGARYQRHVGPVDGEAGDGTTSELALTSWERRGEVSATITTWHPGDDRTTWTVKLRDPDALESVVAGGTHHAAKRSQRLSWAMEFDCRRWWRQVEGGAPARGRAPVMVLLRHPFGQGRLLVRPAATDGGKWRLVLTLDARGRGWVRPLAAIVLPFVRRTLEAKFRELIAETAEDWNKQIAELREFDPREADLWFPRFRGARSELDRWIEENG
ncbi:hypothetical protein [Nonomuraea sp. NPDC048916]|uniref:hypothetical protein n=1 Tax=Nonomuraea sp. NPDC048916 TaxID=3154232 RepID=UPI0033D83D37